MEFVTQEQAVGMAKRAANQHGLPQTVFRTEDTAGWSHTNPFSRVLGQCTTEVFVTALPGRYFS